MSAESALQESVKHGAVLEQRIKKLEREVEATQELLFGALMSVGEPIVVSLQDLREMINGQDHMIDATLNTETDEVTLSLVKLSEQ